MKSQPPGRSAVGSRPVDDGFADGQDRMRAATDAEVMAAALSDPDTPSTEPRFAGNADTAGGLSHIWIEWRRFGVPEPTMMSTMFTLILWLIDPLAHREPWSDPNLSPHQFSPNPETALRPATAMTIPDYQTLMLPLLRIAAEGETCIPDVETRIADGFNLTAEERAALMPTGQQRVLYKRLHWAKFYLAKAGLVETPRRGRFLASPAGRALIARNPPRIDIDLLLTYPGFREFYKGADASGSAPAEVQAATAPASSATPEEQIEAAHSALQAALRADLLQRILQSTPSFFETVIVDLLVAMGYGGSHRNAAQQLGRAGDSGVDGVISEDRLGLDRIYVQAKRYAVANTIGRPDVQGFVGSLLGLGATKGVFVTTSSFSNQATEYVRHLMQRVILIDGQRLAELMIEHNVGIRVSRTVEFKRIDEDFFAEEE
jgi:restriction system protein